MDVKITFPSKHLLEGFEYVNAAATNVEETWRKFGWVPIAERKAELKVQQAVKRMKIRERTDAGS
jgi:hypothetical protein